MTRTPPSAPSDRDAGGSAGAAAREADFGPHWLWSRLETLLPGFPDVALCVALSGGVDSVALLAALAARKRAGMRLRAIHIDHGLFPESPRWASHCRSLARRLHVPLKVLRTRVDVPKGASLEAVAREARYALLAEQLQPGEILLTAQHEDDQLETVLLQLLRGAGVAGLAGMPDIVPFARGWHARPLLSRTRAQLEAWVRSQGLTWVEDVSNLDERFDRNYLRLRVLPLIKARWPGAGRAVARSARHAAEAQRLLDALARMDVEKAAYGPDLSVRRLRCLDPDRRRNALRFWIARSGRSVPDARRLEELAGPVIEARADANPVVAWNGIVAQRQADVLSLRAASRPPEPSGLVWLWRSSPVCDLPNGLGQLQLEADERGPVDLDALPESVEIRWRRGGERLRPRRTGPTRTLKALLQEARVPVADRTRIPLLFAGDRLLAAGDLWIDASIQVQPGTTRRARLRWRR